MTKTSLPLPSAQATEMRTLRRIVLLAFLAAGALVLQVSLSMLPNVELISLWFLMLSLHLSFRESFLVVILFTILQALVWGIGDWVLAYLWVWSVWMILVKILAPVIQQSAFGWALLGCAFGMVFGLLFALQHALLYGVTMGYLYWLRGISFDIIHAFSNYSLILILYTPLSRLMQQLFRKWDYYASNNQSR